MSVCDAKNGLEFQTTARYVCQPVAKSSGSGGVTVLQLQQSGMCECVQSVQSQTRSGGGGQSLQYNCCCVTD